jgi:hypothetical protein
MATILKVHLPFPQHEVYKVSRVTAPFIFNLGTRCSWVVNFTLRAIYSREITPVPIEYEIGSGRFGEEKNFLFLPEFEARIIQPAA